MRTLLTLAAFMAVVVAVAGMATNSFHRPVPDAIQPPEPCPRGCGALNTAGHQCGGAR